MRFVLVLLLFCLCFTLLIAVPIEKSEVGGVSGSVHFLNLYAGSDGSKNKKKTSKNGPFFAKSAKNLKKITFFCKLLNLLGFCYQIFVGNS